MICYMVKTMDMSTALRSAINIVSIAILTSAVSLLCLFIGINGMKDGILLENGFDQSFGVLVFCFGLTLAHCAALSGLYGIIASGVAFAFSEDRKGIIISNSSLMRFITEIFPYIFIMGCVFSLATYLFLDTLNINFLYIGIFILAAFNIAILIKVIADGISTGLGRSRFFHRSEAFPVG